MTDPTAGRLVAGRYEFVRPIGQGAFGRTFLAKDRASGRDVAVKLLDPHGAADWKAFELFEREAAVLRSLRHHGVPEMFDLVKDAWDGANATFLVMEYVAGTSLARMIEEGRQLDPADATHLFVEMLAILDYLHGRTPPILHRDIKPANIIVRDDGLPALVDFGSVRRTFQAPDESGSTVAGTWGYMPYEQYMGQAVPASDLYSLAATFLHLLTGRPPKDFMTDNGRIEVPDTLPGDPRLRAILVRCLRPSPAERFAGAREARHALLSSSSIVPATHRPRAIDGPTKVTLDRVAPSMWALMDTGSKPDQERGLMDVAWFLFFTTVTFGVLPVVFFTMARARRRRLKPFFERGLPATAEVLSIRLEKTAFDQKLAKVSYQFEAEGGMHRDVDPVLPAIADRWQPGDPIRVLYLPDRDFDSVIISIG